VLSGSGNELVILCDNLSSTELFTHHVILGMNDMNFEEREKMEDNVKLHTIQFNDI